MTFAQANSTIFRAHFFFHRKKAQKIELNYCIRKNAMALLSKCHNKQQKPIFVENNFNSKRIDDVRGFAILPSKTFLKRFQLGDFVVQRPFSRIGKSSVLLLIPVWQTILQYDGKLFVAGRTDISKVETMPLMSALYCININAII